MTWLWLALAFLTPAHATTPADLDCAKGDARVDYWQKPDFAALEADPRARAHQRAIAQLMPADLKAFDQECLDRLYASLTSGPLPQTDVDFEGKAFFPDGGGLRRLIQQLLPQGGFKGLLAGAIESNLSILPNALIQGMRFFRIQDGEHPEYKAKVLADVDALLNPSHLLLHRSKGQLIFPSHVYCGQSLLDSRRESIVIDPAYTEDFSDFQSGVDDIPSHKGMNLREEIRMIRPGFYLGRVYGARVYLMSFTLYNDSIARAARAEGNECWQGTQVRGH